MRRRQPAKPVKTAKLEVRCPEKALQTHEEWLRLAAQGSRLGLWRWDEVTKELFWDAKAREMFGVSLVGEATLETFYKALHPDDLERVKNVWRYELERGLPYEIDYRSLRPDGSIRWIHARGSGYYDTGGKPLSMIGVVFDITERKEGERERVELSGRLINAQEEERRRVARELHDDFGQRLALVVNELQQVFDVVQGAQMAISEQVLGLLKSVNQIGTDVQSLSRSLHSSVLETLGLSRSLSFLCSEFLNQQKIQIDLDQSGIPDSIRRETALCLFRIVQEALHNVSKHSRASRVEIKLAGSGAEIALTLSDNGVGFDPSKHPASNGIGIQSMKERAQMLNGTFEIRSAPMMGTQISVKVPLNNLDPTECQKVGPQRLAVQ